ncbi:MAG: TetR/AcrR family transcriptional regulator [Burkholderiaceae bacterium]
MSAPNDTSTNAAPRPRPTRATYRHGDLRRALLQAGIELARSGGPSAIVLREATRRVGVVPNAAYRHFASHLELLQAVRAHALSQVAIAMEKELAAIDADQPAADYARACLRAVGLGYLRYAQAEPGLFKTAFTVPDPIDPNPPPDPAKAGRSGRNPFELLGDALDRMVQAGLLAPDRRPGAEYLAWSAVHGLAYLVLDGPLRAAPPMMILSLSQRQLEMIEYGLTAPVLLARS